jgi:hypothetical protein
VVLIKDHLLHVDVVVVMNYLDVELMIKDHHLLHIDVVVNVEVVMAMVGAVVIVVGILVVVVAVVVVKL